MRLILALGNHPPRYQNTRHNIGFICLDRWASSHKLGFSSDDLYDYLIFKQTVAIKPKTFMNLSGKALRAALLRWKISESLIIHDDIELPSTQLRIRSGGGDAGHNGLKSCFEVMPPSELKRIRIGIGRSSQLPADKYVLQDFEAEELESYAESLKLVSGFLDTYAATDFKQMLNDYSKWKKSYSGGKAAGITSPKEEQG
ncbi:MAG: aminoacyl-tRNA hydrolase [Candidatus Cloacimonetes bacterium]|jgi:PTH1 family peptidyl-tRNA hydrolase|nr:aminoacyl-tRNA hydrolase [Candidatus Cloacimonadota bacterium]MDD2423126.1 aminoacyl-tRNA hydrolase [Candidatus Cloacimonadota bacterium]MDD3562158.1 aminoacyl-tRNA hydrolase [Candidatus Cloacimonadota bacterium]MDD4276701.1 aminoacyl-tRNA hydrolase [Candidatus Cloacimonadota bacterium]MDY0325573.1 aminoacyl-tRNA hydrolase [Candidatus Cloacimonadaceae bacterium]